MLTPEAVPPALVIRPWNDPVVDAIGHDPHSRYVELFWLGILGPTATWLLRRLAFGLDHYPDGYELDLAETAAALGLSFAPGRHSPFLRSLQRCVLFGMANEGPYGLAVRRRVPPLARRQIDRLPPHLQAAHAEWIGPQDPASAERQRAEAVAVALLQHGEPADEVERKLVLLGTPPHTATSAIRAAMSTSYVPLDAA